MLTRLRIAIPVITAGAALALVGLGGCGGGVSDGGAAQVGTQTISQAALDSVVNQRKSAAEQQKQTFPEPGSDQYVAMQQQALESLIFQTIVGIEAKKCGAPCAVSPAMVAAGLKKIITTNFSGNRTQFDDFLKTSGITIADAQRIVRTDLEQPKLLARATPSIAFTAAQALAYCKANPQEFKQAGSREASHILVKTEAEADRIRAMVTTSNFAALAKQYSQDPGSKAHGGSLGAVTKGTLVPEFAKVAFSLTDGAISQPVRTQFGWHIITVKVTGARDIPCSEAEKGIITRQTQMKKSEAEAKWRQKLLTQYAPQISYADDSLKPASTTGA